MDINKILALSDYDYFLHLLFFLRILLASLAGLIIGYERQKRSKGAGLRTHFLVALTSSLMMILSKYAFYDVISELIRLDPSRMAASIVTAISFIGAGVIFTKRNHVIGLTTAAGLWATVGVGMAFGAGMFIEAISTTVIILIIHYIFHRFSFAETKTAYATEKLNLIISDEVLADGKYRDKHAYLLDLETKLEGEKVKIIKRSLEQGPNSLNVAFVLEYPPSYDSNRLRKELFYDKALLRVDFSREDQTM